MALDLYSAHMTRLGRGSVVAGTAALLLTFALTSSPGGESWWLVGLGLQALAIAGAILLGSARLLLPGEHWRTWWGIVLALGSGEAMMLCHARERFPVAFALGVAVLHLVANLATSARVARERGLEPGRRWRQLALVWALPAVGVLVIQAFYRSLDDPSHDDPHDCDGNEYA